MLPLVAAHLHQLRHALRLLERTPHPHDDALTQELNALAQTPTSDTDWLARAQGILTLLEGSLGALLRCESAQRMRGLYVIVDPSLRPQGDIVQVTEAALRGGACVIQWRDKQRDQGDQLPQALQVAEVCRRHGALFIVNDHADLAVACDADGLHLGQHDLPVAQARQVLHPHQLVGRSNALLEEALESQQQGADYIAVGAIFATTTKGNTRPAGLDTLRQVAQQVTAPVVAIAGITQDNVAQVVQAGATAVCVTRAVIAAPDPEQAARRLVQRIEEAGLSPGP